MINREVIRALWFTVGVVAALWCGLMAVVLVGMAVLDLVAPGSIESSGPSDVLVVGAPTVVLFFVARWAFRHSDDLPSAGTESPVVDRFERWTTDHVVVYAFLIALFELVCASFIVPTLITLAAAPFVVGAHLVNAIRKRRYQPS